MNCSKHLPEGGENATRMIRSAYHKKYYAENKERILARQKRWRKENAVIIKARLETKREQINRNRREYRKKNKERVSGYQRKYREKYRERINEQWRQYYAKNKERINQRLRGKKEEEMGHFGLSVDGTWDQGSGKMQVDPISVPSDHVVTLYGISTFDHLFLSRRPEVFSLGDYLREFTYELEDGDHIVEFASVGPKNYGYRTARGKVECKVRGFSLNTRGREQLNFEFLKENVIREVSDPLTDPREIPVFNPHKITRDVNTKQLETLTEIKRYKRYKRVVDTKDYFSYPYGYLLPAEEEEEMLRELNVAWDEQDDMNVELLCEL
ncbi:hypothetical protein ACROYT_G007549 [Oculina patagonica]